MTTATAPTLRENGRVRPPLRLAPAATRRRPALAALAVLLVVVGALGATSAVSRAGHRLPILVLARDVPEGATVTASDLTTVDVAASGLASLPASAAGSVVGQRAALPLLAGTVLTRSALTVGPALLPGQEVVGLALRPGQLPAEGLSVGDQVSVILTTAPGQSAPSATTAGGTGAPGSVLVPDAVVYATAVPGAAAGSGASVVMSLVVPATLAGPLAAAAVAGEVALVLEPGS